MRYLSKEIQHVYASEGARLNNKHIEIMIRQMFSRVYIRKAGDTDLLPGELVEKHRYVTSNDAVGKKGEVQAPAGAARVDLTGKTVMPAMVDLHGHLGYQNSDIETLARLVSLGRLDLSRSISRVIPLEDIQEGIEALERGDGSPIRILVAP